MKNNRIMWGLVSLVVLVTLAVSFGTMTIHSQKDISKSQDDTGFGDSSKFVFVEYNAPESKDVVEREKRNLKNQRYDRQGLVVKNPHPDTEAISVEDEIAPPPIIPAVESDLIIVGEVINANAYLSNDKSGIYTEFTIKTEEILKNDNSNKIVKGDSVIADRTGGAVRYPNGREVFYINAGDDLPRVGSKYLLFLTNDKRSPNYKILNGQELKDNGVVPLDLERSFDTFRETSKQNFVKAVRDKIAESSFGEDVRRKP